MTPARWFGRWRKQKPAAVEEPHRPTYQRDPEGHYIVQFTRTQHIQGQEVSAPIAMVATFDVLRDPVRRNRCIRMENYLPNPALLSADEKHVADDSPLLTLGALVREPLIGLEARLYMGRN